MKSTARLAVLAISLLALALTGCKRENPTQLTDAADSLYKPGQRWNYKHRPGDEGSSLVVVKVDQNPVIGQIVHVRVEGIALRDPRNPEGKTTVMHHLPFTKAAIDLSVTAMAPGEPTAVPEQSVGAYRTWRADFERGVADAWPMPVADVIAMIERTMNASPTPPPGMTNAAPGAAPAPGSAPATAVGTATAATAPAPAHAVATAPAVPTRPTTATPPATTRPANAPALSD